MNRAFPLHLAVLLSVLSLALQGCSKEQLSAEQRSAWEAYALRNCECRDPACAASAKLLPHPEYGRPFDDYEDADKAFIRKMEEISNGCAMERMRANAPPTEPSMDLDLSHLARADGGNPEVTRDAVASKATDTGAAVDVPRPRRTRVQPDRDSGGLNKTAIAQSLRPKMSRISYCYERARMKKPDLAGTVTVKFTVTATGAVQGTSASGMDDADLESCIEKIVADTRFPQPTGGEAVQASYPFTFKP